MEKRIVRIRDHVKLTVSDYVNIFLHYRGMNIGNLAEKMKVNYKTLDARMNNDNFTAYDLLIIANILKIDLNQMNSDISVSFIPLYPRMKSDLREKKKNELIEYIKSQLSQEDYSPIELLSKLNKKYSVYEICDILYQDGQMIFFDRGTIKFKNTKCDERLKVLIDAFWDNLEIAPNQHCHVPSVNESPAFMLWVPYKQRIEKMLKDIISEFYKEHK